jgi:hypothetical protein
MLKIFKTISENQILHTSLVLIFSAHTTLAFDIKVKSVLSLSEESVANRIDQSISQNLAFEKTLTGLKYDSEIPIFVDLANLKFQLSSPKTQMQKIGEQNYFVTDISEVKVDANISNLQIHGTIDKIINGAHLKIKIDSECKDINFEVIFSGNKLTNQISQNSTIAKYEYQNLKTSFKPFTCSHVQGIEDFVAQIATQSLQDQLQIQNFVGEEISKLINDKLNHSKSEAIQQAEIFLQKIDSTATLHIGTSSLNMNQVDGGSVQIPIEIQTTSDKPYISAETNVRPSKNNHKDMILINKNDLEFLIQNASIKKLKSIQYSSNDVPELKKLLQSRLKQFFIWPALLRRPKAAPLTLAPVLEAFHFDLPVETETEQINFKLVVGHWVKDQDLPMVYFRSETDLLMRSTAKVLVSELVNSYVWDQQYLNKNQVSQRISLGLVNSAARNLLQSTVNNQILSAQNSFIKNLRSAFLSKDGTLQLYLK